MVRTRRLRHKSSDTDDQTITPRPTSGLGGPSYLTIAGFIAPAFLLYTFFLIYPLAQTLFFSLYEWTGSVRGEYIGLDNFTELFTRIPLNRQMPRAILHNVILFVGTILVQTSLGLFFAVLLQRRRRGKRFLQATYVLPYMISPLIVGYVWVLILNPTFGPFNNLLDSVGLETISRPWLGDPLTALPVVVLVNAWYWLGFPLLLFSAGIAAIPTDYTEAAVVDGAGSWRVFRHVTLPLLTPVIGAVAVLTFIRTFNIFDLVFALGGSTGNPAGATDVLVLLFYRTAFRGGVDAFGVASALAVVIFAIIFGVSALAQRWFRRLEEGMQ